jgi:hypothetical protein
VLPTDFHQRVVDLEIKVEGRPVGGGASAQDESKMVQHISELMGLYSVSNTVQFSSAQFSSVWRVTHNVNVGCDRVLQQGRRGRIIKLLRRKTFETQ